MAPNSSSNPSEFIDNTWINQSPAERLRTIETLKARGDAAQSTLQHIAQHDEHMQVRCGAVRGLTDLGALATLQAADGEVANAARQQYHRLLAGAIESNLSEQERLAAIQALPLAAIKQIALLAKNKEAGTAALERISQPVELADLCLFAASVHVRKLAALKIEDKALLQELLDKIGSKDKTVAKQLEQKLAALSPESTPAASTTPTAPTETDTTINKAGNATINTTTQANKKPKKAAQKIEKKKTTKQLVEKPQVAPDPAVELPQLEQQLARLTFKHTEALNTARNALNRLRKTIAEDATELVTLAATLQAQLTEKLEKNRVHQEHLQQVTTALLEDLQKALETGQSHDALPAWDKILGNINNTSGKIRAALQKLANKHKDKLNELRDWKSFAATEKKKELITQMQHLMESKMSAADRSRHISKMHQEWKSLGRSNQNEQLWREFKKLSDKAYEPCKEYFKQRKQLMAANFTRRREICAQLEAELTRLESESELNSADLNKLLNEADAQWKAHAPIEQSKIKPLQKRYYAAINQLRKSRKQSLRGNAAQKLGFIAQANALAVHADNQHAMREAKRLQQEWKQIGPTSFKEDRKYWGEFRAACDKIFAKRTQEANSQREEQQQAEGKLVELLHAMEAIFKLDDEAFRNSRSEYQTLAQQFSNAINPGQRNQIKRVLEQFNGLKRKLDSRYKSLPDKKQQQLKNNVLEKARFLQDVEARLLDCQNDAKFAAIKSSIDNHAWQELGASGENKYDQALNERLQRIQQASSLQSLRSIADECAASARALCIELEIRANLETPKEDQALRMQIQLDQLKHGFGKQKPDLKNNSSYAMDIELQSYCLGPIEAKLQQQLSQRLEGAIKKLL